MAPRPIIAGVFGIAPGTNATDADLDAARKLLESVGIVVNVSESDLDAVTGLSGSGPAYVYRFIRALSDQAVAEGLDKEDALLLATKTVMGAAHMLEQTGRPPQELIDQVSSPGGTTLAGLAAMDEAGFDASTAAAVKVATTRSREIAAES